MKKIKGPIAPLKTGNIIYQITLASGMIVTSPAAFGLDERPIEPFPTIVGENGHVLSMRRRRNDEDVRGDHQINGQESQDGPANRS